MKVALGTIVTIFLFIFMILFSTVDAQGNEIDSLKEEFNQERLERLLADQKSEFNQEKILNILAQKYPTEAEIADTNVRNNLNNHTEMEIETVVETLYYFMPTPEDTN